MNLKKGLEYFERTHVGEVVMSDNNIIEKDIGGFHGTDFEEVNRKILYTGKEWLIRKEHTKTIQPPYGQTITKDLGSDTSEISSEKLVEFLRSDEITILELNMFFMNLKANI